MKTQNKVRKAGKERDNKTTYDKKKNEKKDEEQTQKMRKKKHT